MSRLKLSATALCMLTVLLALVPATALASHRHHPHGHHRHIAVVFGTVASTGTKSFDVTTPNDQAVTVAFTEHTKFKPLSSSAGSSIAPGDAVLAVGRFHNGFTARFVAFDTAPFAIPFVRRIFGGTYASSTDTSLTITSRHGKTLTFAVGPETKYWENGKRVDSPTYATNDRVLVLAHRFTDGSWHARFVVIRPPKS